LSSGRRISLAGLAALMGGSGVLHFVKPEPYERIVPRIIGHAEAVVFYSGIAEIVASALLTIPTTRRFGAWLTVVILIGVFPANVQMALDGGTPGGGFFAGSTVLLWLRLPLQPVLIWWAYTFARG
jgi:uncharacterized membrane protein